MAEKPPDSSTVGSAKDTRGHRSRRRVLQTTAVGLGAGVAGCLGLGGGGTTKELRFLAPVAVYDGLKEAWREMADEYEEENNVEISIEVVGFSEVVSSVTNAASGGNPYDLINIPGATNLFTLQSEGLLQPVTDVVDDLGSSHFVDSFLNFGEFDGENWSLPMATTGFCHWSRKDLANEAGYELPSGTDTFTWDEYADMAGTISEQNDDIAGHAFSIQSSYLASVYPWCLFNSNGGLLVSPDGSSVEFDSQAARQTLQYIRDDLFPSVAESPTSYSMVDTRTMFLNSQAAHISFSAFHLPWDIANGAGDLKGNVGVFPIPTRNQSQTPTARMANENIAVGADIEHPDAAKGFLKYMMQPDNAIKWHHGRPMAWVPTQQALVDDRRDELFDPDIYSEFGNLYDQYIAITREYGKPTIYEGGKPTLATAQILSNFSFINCVQDVLLNDVPIDDAVTNYAGNMEQYI